MNSPNRRVLCIGTAAATSVLLMACAPFNFTSTTSSGGTSGGTTTGSTSSQVRAAIDAINSKTPNMNQLSKDIESQAEELDNLAWTASEVVKAVGVSKSLESDLDEMNTEIESISSEVDRTEGLEATAAEKDYISQAKKGVDAAGTGLGTGRKAIARFRAFLQIMVPVMRAMGEYKRASDAIGAGQYARAEAIFRRINRLTASAQHGLSRYVDRNKLPEVKRGLIQFRVVNDYGIATMRALRRGNSSAAVASSKKMDSANKKLTKFHMESELKKHSDFIVGQLNTAGNYISQASVDFLDAQNIYDTRIKAGQ